MLVIKPTGGLCNYLRVIFSYYVYATKTNKKLVVIWLKTSECPGYFLDYFKPIDNIEFCDNSGLKIDYSGYAIMDGYPSNYEKLEPIDSIKSIITNKQKILGNYIGLHIRRTDHVNLAKQYNNYTTDENFFNYLNENGKGINIYIATDNKETFNLFKNRYTDLIKLDYHPTVNALRQTTLGDAIIDLFMCIGADEFMGSGYSSFSDLIINIRREIKDKKLHLLQPPI